MARPLQEGAFDPISPTPPGNDTTLGLLRRLMDELATLFRQEMALATAEVTGAIAKLSIGLVSVISGGAVLFAGFLVLLASATLGLVARGRALAGGSDRRRCGVPHRGCAGDDRAQEDRSVRAQTETCSRLAARRQRSSHEERIMNTNLGSGSGASGSGGQTESSSSSYSGRSPDEIEREIDDTRVRLSQTLDALQSRLSPRERIQAATDSAREMGGRFMQSATHAMTPGITTMIRMDHMHVLALFRRFRPSTSMSRKEALVQSACLALDVHAQLEEEIFYPALRAVVGQNEVLDRSEPEHNEMRNLIAALRSMEVGGPSFDDTFRMLMRTVLHHVADEETVLLPLAEEAMPERLGDLGMPDDQASSGAAATSSRRSRGDDGAVVPRSHCRGGGKRARDGMAGGASGAAVAAYVTCGRAVAAINARAVVAAVTALLAARRLRASYRAAARSSGKSMSLRFSR